MNKTFWNGKKVLITGHTGFKGAWLSLVLKKLGSKLIGYSLPPEHELCLYNICNLKSIFSAESLNNILEAKKLSNFITEQRPDLVFHLAAQPLVRKSYVYPAETFAINLMGTINLFEAIRVNKKTIPIINITSDKCYENLELGKIFKEEDKLGGNDPYSASKACAEIISNSYGKSFAKTNFFINTVRAGNVIGGGDFADDRIIPDCVKAISKEAKLEVRNKSAIRPWQHVLEPIMGYTLVCERLANQTTPNFESWNFGPDVNSVKTVENILDFLTKRYQGFYWSECPLENKLEEAMLLSIDTQKAQKKLGWRSIWSFEKTLKETFDWYDALNSGRDMLQFTEDQIERFISNGK